jgi:hypothetical protein
MTETARSQGPSLEQGCMLSLGVVALTFGGCVLAGSLESEILFELSFMVGSLAALVGVGFLVARIIRSIGRS